MDINRLKLGLVYIFKESDLGKDSRIRLINFIESASMHQLKALALDGALVPEDQLTEEVCERVDQRFDDADVVLNSIRKASLAAVNELSNK